MPRLADDGAHVELTLDGDQLAQLCDWPHGRGPKNDAVTLFTSYIDGLRSGKHSAEIEQDRYIVAVHFWRRFVRSGGSCLKNNGFPKFLAQFRSDRRDR